MTLLAIPWFVLQTTGSVAKTGITAFFTTVPSVLAAFLSGLIIDRLGYKRASVIADIASGISTALIPLLYYTVGLAFWQLLILTFLGGLLKAPGETARDSMVPDLGTGAGMQMERVNAIADGLSRVSGLLGAPLAALLIVFIGASNLLWLDAASFFISALLIGVVVPATPAVISIAKSQERLFNTVFDGLRFILHNRLLRALILTITITNLLDGAMYLVVVPAYAKQFWGNVLPIGLLSATFGGCAFLGTILFGIWGKRLPRRITFALCFMTVSMYFWALAFRLPIPVLVVIYAVQGLMVGPLNPIGMTVQQEIVPPERRARVFGAASAGYLAGVPLGGLVSGYLITGIGLIPTLLVMGTCYLVATGSLLINPALKDMQKALVMPDAT